MTGPASAVSKSLCAPVTSSQLLAAGRLPALDAAARVAVRTVPRSALTAYTQASVDRRHCSAPVVASRAYSEGPSEAWILPPRRPSPRPRPVLNWRRPLPTSSAWTSKDVTYSRSPETTGVPHTSLDMRKRQGRQRSGAGPRPPGGARGGTAAVGAAAGEPFTPAGGRPSRSPGPGARRPPRARPRHAGRARSAPSRRAVGRARCREPRTVPQKRRPAGHRRGRGQRGGRAQIGPAAPGGVRPRGPSGAAEEAAGATPGPRAARSGRRPGGPRSSRWPGTAARPRPYRCRRRRRRRGAGRAGPGGRRGWAAAASICMQDSISGRRSSGSPSRSGPSRSSMNTVSTGWLPWKGACPVAAKTRVEPSEKMSLAPVTLRESRACSGDMYAGVPTATFVSGQAGVGDAGRDAEVDHPGPSSTTRTLDGFRSRWTRPAPWMDWRASAIPAASQRTACVGMGPHSFTISSSEGAGT